MALKIPANQIKNLQQIEVAVSGPDEANRLIIIDGQFDTGNIAADSLNRTNKQTFSVLLGPKLTNRQFLRAIATASFARTQTFGNTMRVNSGLRAARARGARFGRPSTLQKYLPRVRALRETDRNVSQIARELMLPYSSAHKLVRIVTLQPINATS
jgi:hypothetical protein